MRKKSELIPAHRRALVLEHVRAHGSASVQELSEKIEVSPSTIRRDLDDLVELGYLERTHGGAVIETNLRSTFEPDARLAAGIARSQKQAIGAVAAERLHAGDCVVFDSSSTVLEAARIVSWNTLKITAITNDLGIGTVLGQSPSISLIVPGGSLRHGSLTLYGEPGEAFLEAIHADVALMGAHAISHGFLSETSLEVAKIKRLMIGSATRVILLADSQKFRAAAFCRICDLSGIHELIVDDGISEADLAQVRDRNVKVTTVSTSKGEA